MNAPGWLWGTAQAGDTGFCQELLLVNQLTDAAGNQQLLVQDKEILH